MFLAVYIIDLLFQIVGFRFYPLFDFILVLFMFLVTRLLTASVIFG